MGENGDSTLFLEEKIGCCPHFPPIFPLFLSLHIFIMRIAGVLKKYLDKIEKLR